MTFREDGDFIDCRRMGVGGKAIPPNIDKVCFFPEACDRVAGGGRGLYGERARGQDGNTRGG